MDFRQAVDENAWINLHPATKPHGSWRLCIHAVDLDIDPRFPEMAATMDRCPREPELRGSDLRCDTSDLQGQVVALLRPPRSHSHGYGGLAPILVAAIFETIRQLKREGGTILLVEQNARLALDIADRAYVLETGRVTLQGPAAELKHNPQVEHTYLGT